MMGLIQQKLFSPEIIIAAPPSPAMIFCSPPHRNPFWTQTAEENSKMGFPSAILHHTGLILSHNSQSK